MGIVAKAKRYHKAAREGNVKILKEANRWEVNAPDGSGLSPLLWAAGEGHVEAVRVLLKRKAKVCAVDGFGNSALHLAAARGHLECVKVLVAKGANLYGLDGGQRTACDLAKIGEWDEVVELLERMTKILESRNPKRVLKLKKLAQERYEKIKDVVVQEDGNVLRRQESSEFGEREGVGRTEDALNSGEEGSSDEKCPEEKDVQQEHSNLVGLLIHKSGGMSASTSKSTARSYLVFSELIKEQSINQTIVNSLETRPQRAGSPQSPLPADDNVEFTLRAFLELYDLKRIHQQLQDKGLDLDRLMTMTEHDIKTLLGLPLGPHRKLCVALEEYKSTQKRDGP